MAENSERRVGWLELFYDLLFVVLTADTLPRAKRTARESAAQ